MQHVPPKIESQGLSLDSVRKAVTDTIKTLTEADFQSYYDACKFSLGQASVRYYFEEDNIDLDK
jgi:hypothetical protein